MVFRCVCGSDPWPIWEYVPVVVSWADSLWDLHHTTPEELAQGSSQCSVLGLETSWTLHPIVLEEPKIKYFNSQDRPDLVAFNSRKAHFLYPA